MVFFDSTNTRGESDLIQLWTNYGDFNHLKIFLFIRPDTEHHTPDIHVRMCSYMWLTLQRLHSTWSNEISPSAFLYFIMHLTE